MVFTGNAEHMWRPPDMPHAMALEVREMSSMTSRRFGLKLIGRRAGLFLFALLFAAGLTSAASVSLAQVEAKGPASVSGMAEKLLNAVVNISTKQAIKRQRGAPLPKVPRGTPFEEFFKDFFDKRKGGKRRPRRVSSLGSGFVIDASGLIVTNNHVIEGADEITINFHDGSKLKVLEVVGRDKKTDLALLRVKPKKPLDAVSFGSSEGIRVGDWVMAIGNPFGLGGTVTLGIISAKARDINSGPYDDFLQTDAAINKGNSGGPLFNMYGKVIGVNTAIISPSGGSIGIGFSVPSNTAKVVIDQLRKWGEVRRGWLGVSIQAVSDEIASSLGLERSQGALVSRIAEAGPAAKAGLKAGDVILRFDGRKVVSSRNLPRLVAQTAIGRNVDIEVLRSGKREVLKVVLGRLKDKERKPNNSRSSAAGGSGKSEATVLPGLTLAPLTRKLRERFRIDKSISGVVITSVSREGRRGLRGVKAGDTIVEAAQVKVRTLADIAKNVSKTRASGRSKILLGLKDPKGNFRFVAAPLR